MRSVRVVSTGPLLVLRSASAHWQVGVAPSCLATIRLLDRVDLVVHRRECLVVHHADAAGVRILVAALQGCRAVHPPWSGDRESTPGLQVRRASICPALVPTLIAAWQRPSASGLDAPNRSERAPVVHILRATRPGPAAAPPVAAWAAWAASQRDQGGALVILTDQPQAPPHLPSASDWEPTPTDHPASRHHLRADPREAVRETGQGYARGRSGGDAPSVRQYVLRHGRIVTAIATPIVTDTVTRDGDGSGR